MKKNKREQGNSAKRSGVFLQVNLNLGGLMFDNKNISETFKFSKEFLKTYKLVPIANKLFFLREKQSNITTMIQLNFLRKWVMSYLHFNSG